VRDTIVTKELPPAVQELHDQSLTQGRDVLANADPDEKKEWLSKDGTDWSGAFGQDPSAHVDKKGQTKKDIAAANGDYEEDDDDDDDESSDSDSDLGIVDASNSHGVNDTSVDAPGAGKANGAHSKNPVNQVKAYNEEKKGLHRKQRGLMQWKPMRNLAFAKDEAKFAVRRTMKKGSLSGRAPDVETET